jgi:REP element-mobilizing transposase RayT
MPDHVHILAKVRPDRTISDLLRDTKARSSGWIHHTFPQLSNFAWQSGYGAFTVGASQAPAVRNYIRNQHAHHRTVPFESEFISMLDAAEIEYDLRYLWE